MRYACSILVFLAVALTTPVVADDYSQYRDSWSWQFLAATLDHQDAASSRASLGFSPSATDGWDGETAVTTPDGPTVYVAAYRADWPIQPGFYEQDIRTPLVPWQTKKWTLYLWATPDVPSTSEFVELVMSNTMPLPPDAYGLQFNLTLKAKPGSVADGPSVGTVWSLDYAGTTGLALPIYRTDDGLSGYEFELSVTAVPEPSSILILAGGMAYLAPLFMRRRF